MQGRINNELIYEALVPDATIRPPAPGARAGHSKSKFGRKPTAAPGTEASAFGAANPHLDGEAGRNDEDPNMGWLTAYPVEFSDIVREQKGTEAVERTKAIHEAIYRYTRNSIYQTLVLLTGTVLAFIWGLLFGTCFYTTNWLCSPLVYFIRRSFYSASILFTAALRGLFEPCYGGLAFLWNALRFFRSDSSAIGAATAVLQAF